MTEQYPAARRRSAPGGRGGSRDAGQAARPAPGARPAYGGRGPEEDICGEGLRDAEPARDRAARAREICLQLLTSQPRTRAQLAGALARRGIPGEVAEDVLGRFTEAGLIDDAAFARAWVESRHHARGLSGRALAAELRQRGVDDDQVRDAVESLGPEADVQAARALVARRLAATRSLPPEARTRRLAGMLARKGYSPGLAFRVIREALEAEGSDLESLGEEPGFEEEPGCD